MVRPVCQSLQLGLLQQGRLMSVLSGFKMQLIGAQYSSQVPWKPSKKGLIGDPRTRGEARNFDSNAKLKN